MSNFKKMDTNFVFCECENHNEQALLFKENIEGINEWPHNWADGTLSYRLNNFSEDFAYSWQTRAVVVALRTWQLRINKLKFRRERNPTASVDADVWFRPAEDFSSPNVFAHAWYPGQGQVSGDCEINDSWDWVPGVHLSAMNKPPLVPILVHEFGHSMIGLRHDPTDSRQIMYPSFSIGSKKTTLGDRDIFRAQERLGARSLPQHILDYFARRRATNWDF